MKSSFYPPRRASGPAVAVVLLAALLVPALAHSARGDLDRSFSGNGKLRTDFDGYDVASSAAIDSQDRIVAAGDDGRNFALARYTRNGSLDDSFSGNGKLRTDLQGRAKAYSVAIDSHERIVVAGFSTNHRGERDFALARYKRNGSLDRSFSANGKVRTDVGGYNVAESVAIDSHDRIVAAGGAGRGFAWPVTGGTEASTARSPATEG